MRLPTTAKLAKLLASALPATRWVTALIQPSHTVASFSQPVMACASPLAAPPISTSRMCASPALSLALGARRLPLFAPAASPTAPTLSISLAAPVESIVPLAISFLPLNV